MVSVNTVQIARVRRLRAVFVLPMMRLGVLFATYTDGLAAQRVKHAAAPPARRLRRSGARRSSAMPRECSPVS